MRAVPFLALPLIPYLGMSAFGLASLAPGVLACALLTFFSYPPAKLRRQLTEQFARPGATALAAILLIALVLHYAVVVLTETEVDTARFTMSFIVLIVLVCGAVYFGRTLVLFSDGTIDFLTKVVLGFVGVNCIIGVTGVSLLPYMTHKPAGIYSEPSHLALAVAPFLIYAILRGHRIGVYYLIFFAAWAAAIQNLTMLLVVALATLFIEKLSRVLLVAGGVVAALFVLGDLDYFLSRLSISADAENISVIVLLRGWETALGALSESAYWGVGFQQFGIAAPEGRLTDRLADLDLLNQNIHDGGSTAAKLVGEFGVFGIVILALYVMAAVRLWLVLRKRRAHGSMNAATIFLGSAFIALSVELFARGVGYFSPGVFLVISGLGVIFLRDRKSP
jgi:hypothetical protein